MSVVVGIFDDESDLDNAIRRLAERGFEDTVFDLSIVDQEIDDGVPMVVPATSSTPGEVGTFGGHMGHDRAANARIFKAHLEDEFDLPAKVAESYATYATSFFHDGKFVIVKAGDKRRASEAEEILRSCNASQVNRHH